jgi:hypothetical protein
VPAGTRDAQGKFPADSVYGRAEARLGSYARSRREFGAGHGELAAGRADGPKP